MPSIADVVTTSRPSQATYFDANGVLRTAAANVWRRDYDPVTKAPLGLLVEPQRTNFLLWSSDLSNASWAKIGVTVQAVASPSKFPNEWIISDDATTGAHGIGRSNGTPQDGLPTTVNWILKAGTVSRVVVGLRTAGGAPNANYALLDLATRQVFRDVLDGIKLADLGNGWVHISLANPGDLAGSVGAFQINHVGPDDALSYTGNGTRTVIAGPQWVEKGAPAGSYIPTTAAAATRAADNLSFTLPAGVHDLTYTFDDNSTLVVRGISGTYAIPTNLQRPHIKSIVARAA